MNLSQNSSNQSTSDKNKKPESQSPKGGKQSVGSGLVELPTGGGAIRGIGEKFQANPVTGTGSMSVPLAMSEGRGGFTPQLALSYNSGSGNSVFGLGWNVGLPSVTRKTDKGLPRYLDGSQADTFILAGAEDLVLKRNGQGEPLIRTEGDYKVLTYMPRVEGLFACIEYWKKPENGESFWKSISKDNITSLYGYSAQARVADPDAGDRVFEWLLEKTWDAKGNLIQYSYKQENKDNVPEACYEKNKSAIANSYLKRVDYGNKGMFDPATQYTDGWLFSLVFDYGEHGTDSIEETTSWACRADAYSVFRAGFEIRTYRLCGRILMFHNFGAESSQPVLVKASILNYATGSAFTRLSSVVHRFYKGTMTEDMPALAFSYSEAKVGDKLHSIDPHYLNNVPVGSYNDGYTWADLYGEGISGILKQDAHAWYYKSNWGDKNNLTPAGGAGQATMPEPMLGGLSTVMKKPNVPQSAVLTDLNGDGMPDMVVQQPFMKGFYLMDSEGKWNDFRAFKEMPNINLNDPNLRMVDLNGDGHADIIISGDRCFTCYFSKATEGFEPPVFASRPSDEEQGPAIVFADARQSIFLADMTGDGLTDIVRIRHNDICYWPNMGYGRFGKKVQMANPPFLDAYAEFKSQRIRLADVDGTGTTDIIYFGQKGVQYWANQAGNSWSDAIAIANFPRPTDMDYVGVIDLLGNGTSCLVWSPASPASGQQLRFLELTSGIKPYLLTEINNNMGGITRMHYAPSTKFYLRDKFEGKPWITRLPFPVQVLEKVETFDKVTNAAFVNRYAYHHGFFDGVEREFRGFGMVEQWDTDQYEVLATGQGTGTATNIDETTYAPPVYTKTWFHTGYFINGADIAQAFRNEYYKGDTAAWQLPHAVLPQAGGEETRQACRALKGSMLRREVYAQDGSELKDIPYTVEEKTWQVKKLQGLYAGSDAVFMLTEGQGMAWHYERNAADPRILHSLILEADDYGNPLKTAQIAYPRRDVEGRLPEQQQMLVTITQNDFINHPGQDFRYIGVAYQTRQYQLHNMPYNNQLISKEQLLDAFGQAQTIDYADDISGTLLQKRLIQHSRSLFYDQELAAAASLGQIASHAMPYRQEALELTQVLINKVNDNNGLITETILTTESKYIKDGNGYFVVSEVQEFDKGAFYLPVSIIDPFGNETTIEYDTYKLFPTKITNALEEVTEAQYDYRVLKACKITDPNRNSQSIRFNTLGLVEALAVSGKNNGEGDSLESPTISYTYYLNNWQQHQKPVYVVVRSRMQHDDPQSLWLESYVYSSGLGQEAQTKSTAEDGLAWVMVGETLQQREASPRWLASGLKVLNNKGLVVKQYEPWFSASSDYEAEEQLSAFGVSPVMHYDPLGRNIKTDFPDGSFSKVEFSPWVQKNFDQNDNILGSQWIFDANAGTQAQQRAASVSLPHSNSPQCIDFDTLGRPFCTTDDNTVHGKVVTHNTLDITGRPIALTDAKGRVATTRIFALGEKHLLSVQNIDSGRRRMLNDVAGKPVYQWDSRGHRIHYTYDELQRPVSEIVDNGQQVFLAVKNVYGGSVADNNKGRIYQVYDQSGLTEFSSYDFKGNPLVQKKQFCQSYDAPVNWSDDPAPLFQKKYNSNEDEVFTTTWTYNALNQPLLITLPDGSSQQNTYNKAGLLETVSSNGQPYVSNINYNEKGQRSDIHYGNGCKTRYEYDKNTFRLIRLLTTRNTGRDILQDIHYTYDPVGNIVEIVDNAQQYHYFSNSVIEPRAMYKYDALYRLIEATGREKSGLANAFSNTDMGIDFPIPHNGINSMENYTHFYAYDKLGNIMSMNSQGKWLRNYVYAAESNLLLKHDPQQTTDDYAYDAHGNITSMPGIEDMQWNYADYLSKTQCGTVNTWYVYDQSGNRSRKITEKQGGIREERIYLGSYELYRKYQGTELAIERSTVHIMDDKTRVAIVDRQTVENGNTVSGTVNYRYQLSNHLGSATLELDQTAQIISYEEYHPFGTTSYWSGQSESEVKKRRYRYVGKERDEETGLYYYGARYYAAWIGRFVSVDPLAEKYLNLSPYVYVADNPIKYIDPDGKEIIDYMKKTNYGLFSTTQYPDFIGFLGASHGKAFHETRLRMMNSSPIFNKVYHQLEDSKTHFYKITETDITPRGPSGAMRRNINPIDAIGNFSSYKKGTKEDPFIINFNYDQLSTNPVISGHNSQSTVFEEFFHAGQHQFYGVNEPSRLDIEVETKIVKALEGFDNDKEFIGLFDSEEQFNALKYKLLREELSFNDFSLLLNKIAEFAEIVSNTYKKSAIEKGLSKEDAEKMYGIKVYTYSFKYAESLYGKKFEPVETSK